MQRLVADGEQDITVIAGFAGYALTIDTDEFPRFENLFSILMMIAAMRPIALAPTQLAANMPGANGAEFTGAITTDHRRAMIIATVIPGISLGRISLRGLSKLLTSIGASDVTWPRDFAARLLLHRTQPLFL